MYPTVLKDAIESFRKLPGIGEKSAERFAFSLLDLSDEDIANFVKSVSECKKNIHKCSVCGHLTDSDKCLICENENRKDNVLCVVEDYKSVFMFEKSGVFDGKYHVLDGLISPIDGIYPEDINLSSLVDRVNKCDGPVEIIVALKPSVEGETTTLYIKKILEGKDVTVTRLSYGIPIGVDIDYLDSMTLDRALLDRKEI
jgi:recombination protein RecR